MITLAVVNLKGGTTKTTTAGFLCAAFHEAGLRVIGVDADGENESLQGWATAGELPFNVMTLAVKDLHRQIPGIVDPSRFDVVVIDTPPMEAQRGTVLSAARIASHVVVPVAPTPIEYDRLAKVRGLVDEVPDLRADGRAPVFAVLLTRVKAQAASSKVYRDLITGDGVTVLRAQVGNLERFAQAWGDPIKNATGSSYGDAALELLDLGQEAMA